MDIQFVEFPSSCFEGFLINIDIKIQLYALVKNGIMNVHALGSLQNETIKLTQFIDNDREKPSPLIAKIAK